VVEQRRRREALDRTVVLGDDLPFVADRDRVRADSAATRNPTRRVGTE
jgi:hypothetical protein